MSTPEERRGRQQLAAIRAYARLRLKEQGMLSPGQAADHSTVREHQLDKVVRQEDGWRGGWHGRHSLGDGGFWNRPKVGA